MVTGGVSAGELVLGAIAICATTILVGLFLVATGSEVDDAMDPRPSNPTARELFSIELFAEGSGVRFRGPIRHGATRQLDTALREGGQIRFLELDSPGGLVAEARGLVRLVEHFGLDTYVVHQCLSACTLTFASGKKRHLAPGARLGFHRYRQDSPTVVYFMDPRAEQERDMEIFRRRSVPQVFIERIAATPPSRMWFPSHRELLAARLVDVIGDPY